LGSGGLGPPTLSNNTQTFFGYYKKTPRRKKQIGWGKRKRRKTGGKKKQGHRKTNRLGKWVWWAGKLKNLGVAKK